MKQAGDGSLGGDLSAVGAGDADGAEVAVGDDGATGSGTVEFDGPGVAAVFTVMILWSAFGSVFALLLGYSRVPYAAAREGYFFKAFARLHPTRGFPHVSLVVLGLISIVTSVLPLDVVIDALLATRIVVQFVGQIGGVILLRRRAPGMVRPFRIWLYPLPVVVGLAGWLFIFATTGVSIVLFGIGVLALGVLCFLGWSARTRQWPFAVPPLSPP